MYYFLYLCLVECIFWLILFYFARLPGFRREMLFTSLIGLVSGWFSPLYIGIYWNPTIFYYIRVFGIAFDIETFIFGFSFFGVAAGITSQFFGRNIIPNQSRRYLSYLPILIFYPFVILFVGVFLAPRYAGIITDLTFGIILGTIFTVRKDLSYVALTGGAIFAIQYCILLGMGFLVFPNFFQSWNQSELCGIFLCNLPIEEIIFAFLYGAMGAVAYKFIFSYRI